MAKPQYATKEYRYQRKRWAPIVAAGQALCAQPVCLMTSRHIPAGAPFDLAHDDSGYVILGPAHQRCNRSDGGKRRHLLAPTTPKRLVL